MRVDSRSIARAPAPDPAGPPATAGAWALTLWTAGRAPVLVGLNPDGVGLSDVGHMVRRRWDGLSQAFAGVVSDELAVLPDRVRGIVHIPACRPPVHIEPLVAWLKAAVAREARAVCLVTSGIWEPGFEAQPLDGIEELALWRRRIRSAAAALFRAPGGAYPGAPAGAGEPPW